MRAFLSFSPHETRAFGRTLAKRATKGSKRRGAAIFALNGGLGAGKTTFVQGFLAGLGVKGRAASPTFIIMRRHPIKRRRGSAFHIDAYRLKKPSDLAALGWEEMVRDPRNVILIEWAENIKRLLPKYAIWLRFRHGKSRSERHISMRPAA